MPASIVKSFAQKSGKTETEVEELWTKAKEIAKENGREEEYDYIVGVLKKMLSLNEEDAGGDAGGGTTSADVAGVELPVGDVDDKEKKKRVKVMRRKMQTLMNDK